MSYDSPTEGVVEFGTTGSLTVKGAEVPLNTGKRFDNPWAVADFDTPQITIADKAGDVRLDFSRGSRSVSAKHVHHGHGRHGNDRPGRGDED